MTDPRETASANEPGVPPTRGGSGGPARQTSGVGVAAGETARFMDDLDWPSNDDDPNWAQCPECGHAVYIPWAKPCGDPNCPAGTA